MVLLTTLYGGFTEKGFMFPSGEIIKCIVDMRPKYTLGWWTVLLMSLSDSRPISLENSVIVKSYRAILDFK